MDRARFSVAIASIALLAATLPGAALAQDAAATPEGTEWSLTEYSSDGTLAAVPTDVGATLLLEDGLATGFGGCNSFFGSYSIDGQAIELGQEMGQTRKLCEGEAQAVEDAYLAALPTVTAWSIDDGALQLRDESGSALLIYGEASQDFSAAGSGSILAALALLTEQMATLEERIVVLEDGDGGATTIEPEEPRSPRVPRAADKVKTQFPDWMRDELRPESERSEERNRETATWTDRADDETGFRVYARRGYCQLKPSADPAAELTGEDFRKARAEAVLVDEVAADTTSYRPDHAAIDAALPAAPESPYSNDQFYDLLVAAVNDVGESRAVRVASWFLTPEFNCP